MPEPPATNEPDDEDVPLFGTWRRAYAAVVACNIVVLFLLFLFSRWAF